MSTPITFIPAELRSEMLLRASRVQDMMQHEHIDGILLATNANVYYTTGRFFRGYVYLPAQGDPVYFIIRPNGYDLAGVRAFYVRKPEQIPDVMAENAIDIPAVLGLDEDSLSYTETMRVRAVFPDATYVNAGPVMRRARMQKTPLELKLMQIDGLHQAAVYKRLPHLYREDMTDVEFQIEIERVLRLEGALGYSRMSGRLMEINLGSVLYGENADTPTPYEFALGGGGTDPSLPVGADGSIMHAGHTVMVDMNGGFNGYQSDMTRVWRRGDIPELAYKAHECSRAILRRLEQIGRPGFAVSALYEEAMKIVEAEKLADYFMGHIQKAGFIDHGVGIELNEQPAITPRSRESLLENMTIALEPKFVIPGVGAVGVENTYIVTADGLRSITPFPEEIQEL